MAYSTTHDNTRLYVKDWGAGQPAILLHDWPLSADSWDEAATNFRPDLAAFTVPTLVIHGTQDKTVPIDATGRVVAKAVPMPPTSSTTGRHTAYSPRTRST